MNLDSLYGGEIQIASSSFASELALRAGGIVEEVVGPEPESLDAAKFRIALGVVRERVAGSECAALAGRCLTSLGLDTSDVRLDVVRLRAVAPGLERVEAAAPVFYAHRDTWYGNPSCQINAWIPLHRVTPENSFRYFLDYFERPIANDSGGFLADEFRGFGSVAPVGVSSYPRALDNPAGRQWDVEMEGGDVLLFSAAHLHQTLPNRTSRVRFSVDFRFYLESDLKGSRGAPDPDNKSVGIFRYPPCE